MYTAQVYNRLKVHLRTHGLYKYGCLNVFIFLVQWKYLYNIIIHTLVYTCEILYMYTASILVYKVYSYVCNRLNAVQVYLCRVSAIWPSGII